MDSPTLSLHLFNLNPSFQAQDNFHDFLQAHISSTLLYTIPVLLQKRMHTPISDSLLTIYTLLCATRFYFSHFLLTTWEVHEPPLLLLVVSMVCWCFFSKTCRVRPSCKFQGHRPIQSKHRSGREYRRNQRWKEWRKRFAGERQMCPHD